MVGCGDIILVMIRFIDIGSQIGLDDEWPRTFAFYNTVPDMFIDLGGSGCQTWESWKDFEEDWLLSDRSQPLERFRGLCPDWVF